MVLVVFATVFALEVRFLSNRLYADGVEIVAWGCIGLSLCSSDFEAEEEETRGWSRKKEEGREIPRRPCHLLSKIGVRSGPEDEFNVLTAVLMAIQVRWCDRRMSSPSGRDGGSKTAFGKVQTGKKHGLLPWVPLFVHSPCH